MRRSDELARRVDGFHRPDGHDAQPLNGRYFVHLFSFLNHLPCKTVGATPDGRREASRWPILIGATGAR